MTGMIGTECRLLGTERISMADLIDRLDGRSNGQGNDRDE